MRRLSFAIGLILGVVTYTFAQSPHGDGLKIDCASCHNPSGWEIEFEEMTFDHASTGFDLEGTHAQANCASCHTDLVFENTPNDCISCHTDVHEQSVGNDCMRCHSSESWLVFNIPELHEQNGFPLIGAHTDVDCAACHTSATSLKFTPMGNECIQCHLQDYNATSNPNHAISGFSTDCLECHDPMGIDWESSGFNHDFFPLTGGHDIADCSECHDITNFSNISPECVACHAEDYAQTSNPPHADAGFPTDCATCHTTNPGWVPATINHDFFPLTLGHDIEDCAACHINNNYVDTPTECVACHQDDYNASTNPNHVAAQFPTECATCHTTNPGWSPASLDHGFFPLTLGHDIGDCTACHINNNYVDTPTDCVACHLEDYNTATDPNHLAAQFPTDCASCHTTNPGWMPATFDHDGMYFPIYSGRHEGEWSQCIDCHTDPSNYSIFNCLVCHPQPDMDDRHDEVPDYIYENNACFICHPTGEAD